MKTPVNILARRSLGLLLLLSCLIPVLSACGGSYRNDLTAPEVMASVEAALPVGDGYRAAGEDFITASEWGDEYTTLLDMLAEHRILLSERSDSNVDEIGILHIKSDGDMREAKAIVEAYVSAKQLRLKSLLEAYNPDELPKVENGKVTVCGQYILYTILGDSETTQAHEAFKTALAES